MTVVSKTAKSVVIFWSYSPNLFSGGISFYVALARKTNSSSESTGEIVAKNTTASVISQLHARTEYNVAVVAVNGHGTPFRSRHVLVITHEGGELCTLLLFC